MAIDIVKEASVSSYGLLATFLPEAAKDHQERTPQDRAVVSTWLGHLTWYIALRRIGLEPEFAPADGKRQRVQ